MIAEAALMKLDDLKRRYDSIRPEDCALIAFEAIQFAGDLICIGETSRESFAAGMREACDHPLTDEWIDAAFGRYCVALALAGEIGPAPLWKGGERS